MDNDPNFLIPATCESFPSNYKDEMFTLWYSLGKPSPLTFHKKMPPCADVGNRKPSYRTTKSWIAEFHERAVVLDEQVFRQINERLVADKVAMLERHTTVALEMQNIAIRFLREHEEDLRVPDAVKLLIAGIEIERESRGIATTVEKISRMSDEELTKEIAKLISTAPVTFLSSESGEEDADYSGGTTTN